MLDLAGRRAERGTLRCFTHVSTAYVAGTHSGTFGERDLDLGQDHRNAYERSKLEAEALVREHADELPVLRPSPEHRRRRLEDRLDAGLQRPLLAAAGVRPRQLLGAAGEPDLAGRRRPRRLRRRRPARARRHLRGHLQPDRLGARSELGELVQLACTHLERTPPRLVPHTSTAACFTPSSCARARTGGVGAAGQRGLLPLLLDGDRYDAAHARGALRTSGIEPPSLPRYFDRLIDYALRAEWGRKPVPRHRLLAPAHAAEHVRATEHVEGRVRQPPTREHEIVRR